MILRDNEKVLQFYIKIKEKKNESTIFLSIKLIKLKEIVHLLKFS